MGTCHVDATKGVLVMLLSEPDLIVREAKLFEREHWTTDEPPVLKPDMYLVLLEFGPDKLPDGYHYVRELILDKNGARTKKWSDT